MYRIVLLVVVAACTPPDFDGRYRAESYTLDPSSCDGPGQEVALRPFSTFEIRHRKFFGVRIHPVYPCDESGACAEDNDTDWNLVVVEDDLDQVAMEYTRSEGNSCVLSSQDKVIEDGADGAVVLQSRTYELVIEPYNASSCTTDNAKAMRGRMKCASVLQLVGIPQV